MSDVESEPAFGAGEDQDILEYKSISSLALASLGLGLVSFLSVVVTLLWPLPVAAIVLGTLALRTIAASTALTGKWAAVIGVALGIMFLTVIPARYFSRDYVLKVRAREFADTWLELLRQGELDRAHQATLPVTQRQVRGSSLKAFYRRNEEQRQRKEEFFEVDPTSRIITLGTSATTRFRRTLVRESQLGNEYVYLLYDLEYELDGKAHVVPFRIAVQRRENAATGAGTWQVNLLALESSVTDG